MRVEEDNSNDVDYAPLRGGVFHARHAVPDLTELIQQNVLLL